ncbi:hypothetical protein BW723_01660 [Polaribacter reichenbachii]|uniref:Uncharacterized protein n=1 Tax=Polaribacter reichenbachii TaxID=996801 RepID=A0A1B8TWD8_9FLAO|nr:hypothetical protein [Polaribacter reichenbachii]APZ45078.1 hypothetical protein BW723_01660 [Polaribacter reichenbachii]AUC18940.1 hypothetical protein BTO17_09660 [Polaribacter reichenbachii]OBY63902.1 hypothetical protein LPB301_14040 [Polaribacter reichenbachii]
MKIPKLIYFLLSFFIFTSCAESLDFDQLEDYLAKPVFTASLTYFNVQPFQFFDENGVQQNSREDITDFIVFENSFFRENVVKIVFNAEFKNEFDRAVRIEVDFLNENNIAIYSFAPIIVEGGDTIPPPYEEEIIIASSLNVLSATKVRFRAFLEDTGTQMNPLDTSEFEFRSSVTLFVETDL